MLEIEVSFGASPLVSGCEQIYNSWEAEKSVLLVYSTSTTHSGDWPTSVLLWIWMKHSQILKVLPNISVTGHIPFILCQDNNLAPQDLKNNLQDFYMHPYESI